MPGGDVAAGAALDDAQLLDLLAAQGDHHPPARGELVALGRIRQKGGKLVEPFALEGDLDPAAISSNSFTVEWPPRSGRVRAYPEVDRAAWFPLAEAREKILPSQLPILDAFERL